MSEQIITDNKEILKRYHAKPTMQEDQPDNPICFYCGKRKTQVGRFFRCNCSGKQIYTKSGIPIKRHLKQKI